MDDPVDIRKPDSEVPPWYDNFYVKGIPFRRAEENGERIYTYERVANVVPKLKVRESDVFLVTYPRSGTHWMKFILACLFSKDSDYEKVRNTQLNETVPYLDMGDDVFGAESTPEEQVRRWEENTETRLFNTHFDWTLMPPGLNEGKGKVVYVIRNPKDSFVSMYQWMTGKTQTLHFKGTFGEFFEGYLAGKISWGGGDYFSFAKKWLQQRSHIPMCIVHYEDLKKTPAEEIRRLAEFLGRPVSDENIETIADLCGFEKMKDYKCLAAVEEYLDKPDAKFMKKGCVGYWKNTLTVAQSEELDRRLAKLAEDTGYTIKME